ncbi:DUF3551 domain-containing protein [Bradyrhizobium sp. LHD-71]|uniref:DUF3551 domain-containing protein n=1 Tax=Bradyrhizobium sp. LHD-71 TaxID=3072141 RepID=UPI00280CE459|nr:DUF3551 domain-containing protein [Bradyrhizobium sp. LHD-71]MDQ8730513.1 DUF3551 domain-containing protein [Bradyrhizobium sp. LHD-71]
MKTQTLIRTASALAVLAAGFLAGQPAEAQSAVREPNGAIRFYDQYGQDRGYAWCLRRGGRQWSGSSDCSYFTYAQCQASIIGPMGGDCTPNPFAAYATVPPPGTRWR